MSNPPLTGDARLAQLARSKVARKRKDRFVESISLLAACVSVFTTLAIVYILIKESLVFFLAGATVGFPHGHAVDTIVR